MKFGCSICIFLNSENLICPSTEISKCFRGSLQLRDNESRLYIVHVYYNELCKMYFLISIHIYLAITMIIIAHFHSGDNN